MPTIAAPHDLFVGNPHVAEGVALAVVVGGLDGLAAHVFAYLTHSSTPKS